jgi:hypothetical protein
MSQGPLKSTDWLATAATAWHAIKAALRSLSIQMVLRVGEFLFRCLVRPMVLHDASRQRSAFSHSQPVRNPTCALPKEHH